jgi:hypothetical protein
MQYFKFKIYALMIASAVIGFGIMACNRESLLDDIEIPITNPLINIVNIQLVDAQTLEPVKSDQLIIEKAGTDKDKIYSLEGKKALSIQNGFISIGVLKSDTPTVGKKLDFMLLIKPVNANSTYIENRQIFSVLNASVTQVHTVRMLDKNNLPSGVKVEQQNFQLDAAGKTVAPVILTTNTSLPENTTITLPSGTVLKDKDGNPVSGAIVATMTTFNATDPNSLNSFPGGLVFNGAKDSSGNNLGGGTFTTFGFISLSMSAGGKEVKSFSQPLDVAVDVSTSIQRVVETGGTPRPSQAGDKIPVWSMNDSTTEWNAETVAELVTDPVTGKLKAQFKQSHLSLWNLDDPACPAMINWFIQRFVFGRNVPFVPCNRCNNAAVKFLTQPYVNSSYYTEISSPTNPNMSIKKDYINYRNDNVLNFTNYLGEGQTDAEARIIFKIFDKEPWNGGRLFYTSPAVRPCEAPAILDMRSVAFPQFATINVDFEFKCPSAASTVKPTVTLYYKDVSPGSTDKTWTYVGEMRKGVGSTSGKLQGGKKYKFGIFHGSLNFTTDDVTIYQNGTQVNAITMPVNLTDPVTIRLVNVGWKLDQTISLAPASSERTYNFQMLFTASPELCTRYKKYF